MDQPPQEHNIPRTTLDLMRSVESAPPGDIERAMHCTNQQAVILRLELPTSKPPASLDALANVIDIPIYKTSDLQDESTALVHNENRVIFVKEGLPLQNQLHAALRELKALIDLPIRLEHGDGHLTQDDYQRLAEHFADLVMDPHGP